MHKNSCVEIKLRAFQKESITINGHWKGGVVILLIQNTIIFENYLFPEILSCVLNLHVFIRKLIFLVQLQGHIALFAIYIVLLKNSIITLGPTDNQVIIDFAIYTHAFISPGIANCFVPVFVL